MISTQYFFSYHSYFVICGLKCYLFVKKIALFLEIWDLTAKHFNTLMCTLLSIVACSCIEYQKKLHFSRIVVGNHIRNTLCAL